MLDTTLSTEFVPGTNVKGEVAGANWLFLLPSLELGQVLCIGAIGPASLLALARVADDIVVLAERPETAQRIGEIAHRHGFSNVRCLDTAVALAPQSVELVLLDDDGMRYLTRDAAALSDLLRVLRPDALIYFDHGGGVDREAWRRLAEIAGATQSFWLTPMGGEMHTAVRAQDEATRAYFLRNGLTSRSFNLGALKRAVRANLQPEGQPGTRARPGLPAASPRAAGRRTLKGRAKRAVRTTLASLFNGVQGALDGAEQRIGSSVLGGVASRYGVLAGAPGELTEQPPRYLRDIAKAAGVDIEHHRWGLSARGEYSSRKVLVFLFNHADESPEYIVKMTRDPALNSRLENERRALAVLEERGIGDRETLPRAAFFGHHRRLAILGETIVEGVPFERRTSGAADCPHAADAIAWLTDLGARTADRSAATPGQVAAGLGKLLKRFAEIYRPDPDHLRFLEAQVAALAGGQEAFPLVFQHGDPGTWNAMVTPSGRAAFLDWEAAETQGMPLWDLFYFVRTYGAWSLRAGVAGDVTKGFAAQFLDTTPFRSLLIESAERYCSEVGIAQHYVEPLFYTCWMHRALKEATRLSPSALGNGHYVNILRASVERRESLLALFATPAVV